MPKSLWVPLRAIYCVGNGSCSISPSEIWRTGLRIARAPPVGPSRVLARGRTSATSGTPRARSWAVLGVPVRLGVLIAGRPRVAKV